MLAHNKAVIAPSPEHALLNVQGGQSECVLVVGFEKARPPHSSLCMRPWEGHLRAGHGYFWRRV